MDASTGRLVVEERSNRAGRSLDEDEREAALADHVSQAILLREAYRNGWQRELPRVRQRLVLAMRTALEDDVTEPSDSQLRAFFDAHRDKYRLPATVTLSHVYFVPGSPETPQDPEAFVAALSRNVDFRSRGESFPLGPTLERFTLVRLSGTLGETFADEVFASVGSSWFGPVRSTRGVHYVRVDERREATSPDFTAVARYVRVDWVTERRRTQYERKMARLADGYEIRIDEP